MSEWIPLLATQPTTLPALLGASGLPSDDRTLANIWSANENRANHRGALRAPYEVRADETWYVPPPPATGDGVLATYTCTGSERSTDEIAAAIRASHGEGAAVELTVAPAAFTSDYLLGLAHNQPFRCRRQATPPIPIAANETVRYPTRRRRTRTLDVAPSTQLRRSQNPVLTGDGPFIVRVELARTGQVLKILDMVPEPRAVNPRDPTLPVEAHWRPADGKVEFKITITPRAGDVAPTRVTIRVRHPDGRVYYNEERTDWTRTGEHVWAWDGFTTPRPAAGAPDTGDADTRVLRGRLTVEVVVMAASGWSLGFLELANRSHKAGFIDVRKQGSSTIDAYAYLAFHHGNEDGGVWAATALGAVLAGGLGVAGAAIARAVADGDGTPLTPDEERDYGIAMGVAGAATAALFLGIMGGILAATRLSEADYNALRGDVERGITAHWRRTGLQIDGSAYAFQAHPVTSGGHDRIQYGLVSSAISGRACNLVPVLGVVFVPYLSGARAHNLYAGAHEFGHSILLATSDSGWSMHHKGSTDLLQNAVTGPSGFRRPATESDLMIYYDDRGPWPYDRLWAAPSEVLGWIEVAQTEFVAM
ncbi:MAG: hypothetical protein HY908_25245 [Myxococcales bacterium]|nr:hypothetical protein [Myxococcales bacterium]